MCPLNCQSTYKDIVNNALKFGGILFSPIRLTAVACYAAGPLKVRLSFRIQNVQPSPPKPLRKHRYRRTHFITVHYSQLTNMVLTPLATIIACSEVHCGLKYQHWPMKQKLFLYQKHYQWLLYPYNSDKINAYKSEISTNIDVYSYRQSNRHSSWIAGITCRGCGFVTCNTDVNLLKTSWHPQKAGIHTAITS